MSSVIKTVFASAIALTLSSGVAAQEPLNRAERDRLIDDQRKVEDRMIAMTQNKYVLSQWLKIDTSPKDDTVWVSAATVGATAIDHYALVWKCLDEALQKNNRGWDERFCDNWARNVRWERDKKAGQKTTVR